MLEQLGLTSLVIGFIMTWDNIINMFFQPWVGARSDRTRTRFGRRKPWLMVGAPIAAVFFLFGLKVAFINPLYDTIEFVPWVTNTDVVAIVPWLLIAGAVVAVLASLVGMRRFLDV